MTQFEDWLTTDGVYIGIVVGLAIAAYIAWSIICCLIVRAFIHTGIAARQISRQATSATTNVGKELLRVATHEADHDDDNDSKETESSKYTNNNNNNNNDSNEKKRDLVSNDEKHNITARANTIGSVIRSVGNILIIATSLIMILETIGIHINSLLSFFALSGLTMSLAVSRGVSDFVSGLFILIEGSYNINEIVTINGIFGVIEDMKLRVTYIRGLDGTLYTIPNGMITNIANHNRGYNICIINVGITYECNVNKCVELLNGIISESIINDKRLTMLYGNKNINNNNNNNKNSKHSSGVIINKPCVDGINELGDSSVNLRYLIVTKAGLKAIVERIGNEYIHKYLKEYLAYPTKRHITQIDGSKNNDNNNNNNNSNDFESKENHIEYVNNNTDNRQIYDKNDNENNMSKQDMLEDNNDNNDNQSGFVD